MHDGSAVTMADAMVAHNSAVAAIRAEDLAPLIAFLESLTDHAFLTNPAFGPPAATCPAK
jgi:cytochrome c peroxidase